MTKRTMLLWALLLGLTISLVGSLYAQRTVVANECENCGVAGALPSVVATAQYNNYRTGWYPYEYQLWPDTVSPATFGKKWTVTLDGQVYGSPLYYAGIVYVATENNLVYALDAETGAQVWAAPYFLGTPALRSQLSCGNITPNVGITSTPVLDVYTGTLYVVGLLRSPFQYKMAAVDMFTGESRSGWPVTINPPAPAPGITPANTSQRGALVLSYGVVYVGFGGYFGDCGAYHGWVVGVDAYNPFTPQMWYRTPTTTRGSGIWAAGGLAADEYGFIYPSTGNSFGTPVGLDYSNAVLRLYPDLSFTTATTDYFIPSDWRALNAADADLGGSPVTLLPPQAGSVTPNMAFIAGKRGIGHLLNRDDFGGVARGDGTSREGLYSRRISNNTNNAAFSTAAYYEDPDGGVGPRIFLSLRGTQPNCSPSGSVAAMALETDGAGNSSYRALWCTPTTTAQSPVVTNYQGIPGTGILWVVTSGGTLYAFNAATGQQLYNSNQVAGDTLGATRALGHFTVVDGKAFIPTSSNAIVAYGLR